jgi:nucleoside 2-deoxyribosyltransferase
MTKVYFACSVRGGGDTSNYLALLETIKDAGGEVLSEIFVNDAIQLGGSPLPEPEVYARDISMIQEADVVIAEVTNPSLGVGYELGYAEKLNKPILCLFDGDSGGKLSAMVRGNPYNIIATYSEDSLPSEEIATLIRYAQSTENSSK